MYVYDMRRPIAGQGRRDIFDLQAVAREQDFANRVIESDGWLSEVTTRPPIREVVEQSDGEPVIYRYSVCKASPFDSHQTANHPQAARCLYCGYLLSK